MCRDDQGYSRNEEPGLVLYKELFQHQEDKAREENYLGKVAMMMFAVAMPEGDGTYREGQPDHTDLKEEIVDNIYAE